MRIHIDAVPVSTFRRMGRGVIVPRWVGHKASSEKVRRAGDVVETALSTATSRRPVRLMQDPASSNNGFTICASPSVSIQSTNTAMETTTMVKSLLIGETSFVMAKASSIAQTSKSVRTTSTMVNGVKTSEKAKATAITITKIFMWGSGRPTNVMVRAKYSHANRIVIKALGRMICAMGAEY